MGRALLQTSGPGAPPEGTTEVRTARAYFVFVALLGALAVVLVLLSSRDPSRRVTREDFGSAWPLTIPSAVLTCEFRQEITVTSGGTTYTLNRPDEHGAYEDVGRIWADGPAGKVDLSSLIEAGLKLCD